jgi:hypothetical protein
MSISASDLENDMTCWVMMDVAPPAALSLVGRQAGLATPAHLSLPLYVTGGSLPLIVVGLGMLSRLLLSPDRLLYELHAPVLGLVAGW